MKCIVKRIVEIATMRLNGTKTKTELTEQQQKVQVAFSKYDFGCHTAGVASILEAITGRKPTKKEPSGLEMFDVVTTVDGKRLIVLGVDCNNGTAYGFPVDSPTQGYLSFGNSGHKIKEMTVEEKGNVLDAFSKLDDAPVMTWVCRNLAGEFPAKLLESLGD